MSALLALKYPTDFAMNQSEGGGWRPTPGNGGMRRLAVVGFAWSASQTLLLQGLALLTQLVLARLLEPRLFGVIAVAATISAVCTTLADSGMSSAIIRAPSLSRTDLETAWWLNVGFGTVLAIALVALSPLLGPLVGNGQLVEVLPLYAVTIVVSAATSVPLALIQRRMAFHTQLAVTIPASVVGAAVAVTVAWISPSVFALAIQPLIAAVATAVVLMLMRAYIIGFHFDRSTARSMLKFGLPLAGSSTIDTLWNGLPAVYIAAVVGAAPAGIYFMADRLRGALVSTVFNAIASVTFPALSTVSHDNKLFVSYIRSAIRASSALCAPVFLVVAAQAENVFALLLGRNWSGGALYLTVMMIGSLMYPPNSVNIAVMKAAGESSLIFYLEVTKKAIVLGLLVFVLPLGILPYLWAMVLFGIFAYIPNSWFVSHSVGYRYRDQLVDICLPILVAAVPASILWTVDAVTRPSPAFAVLVLSPLSILVGWAGTVAITPSLRRMAIRRVPGLRRSR
ncbi:lipopolysaccharide biosynthesis protein [Humibacter ginsengiterrae]